MTPTEILQAAKAKIADPAHWCQGTMAKDGNGIRTSSSKPSATQWCLAGAMDIAGTVDAFTSLQEAWKYLYKANDYTSVGQFNDSHTHAEVLALVDKAIQLSQEDAHAQVQARG